MFAPGSYAGVDENALRDRATAAETRIQNILSEIAQHERYLVDEGKKLRRSGAKLGFHAAVSIGGLIVAPLTFGWSLLVTAGDTALLAMELDEYGAGSFDLHATACK